MGLRVGDIVYFNGELRVVSGKSNVGGKEFVFFNNDGKRPHESDSSLVKIMTNQQSLQVLENFDSFNFLSIERRDFLKNLLTRLTSGECHEMLRDSQKYGFTEEEIKLIWKRMLPIYEP